jgi:hypothetical protein
MKYNDGDCSFDFNSNPCKMSQEETGVQKYPEENSSLLHIQKAKLIVASNRKRLKRLKAKRSQLHDDQSKISTLKACQKRSPYYYNWIMKQLERFRNKGSPKYDLQERAFAMTMYYSCGVNGYR